MCGRYALYGPISRLREQFDIDLGYNDFEIIPRDASKPFGWADRYNIAPTQTTPVIHTAGDHREIITARWGFVPRWVKEPGSLAQPINAKIETAGEKPMFRHAFARSRVLVPASGFYEWQAVPGAKSKQPWYVRPVGGEMLFGFGGLLERWSGPDGEVLTFAILTTAANELMRPIHERMPVIIRPEDYGTWLDAGITDVELVREIARAYPVDQMEAYRVGRTVGSSRATGPDLVAPTDDRTGA